jgi:hypothetical protein
MRQKMQEEDVVLPMGYFEGCEASVTALMNTKHDRMEVGILSL